MEPLNGSSYAIIGMAKKIQDKRKVNNRVQESQMVLAGLSLLLSVTQNKFAAALFITYLCNLMQLLKAKCFGICCWVLFPPPPFWANKCRQKIRSEYCIFLHGYVGVSGFGFLFLVCFNFFLVGWFGFFRFLLFWGCWLIGWLGFFNQFWLLHVLARQY